MYKNSSNKSLLSIDTLIQLDICFKAVGALSVTMALDSRTVLSNDNV